MRRSFKQKHVCNTVHEMNWKNLQAQKNGRHVLKKAKKAERSINIVTLFSPFSTVPDIQPQCLNSGYESLADRKPR